MTDVDVLDERLRNLTDMVKEGFSDTKRSLEENSLVHERLFDKLGELKLDFEKWKSKWSVILSIGTFIVTSVASYLIHLLEKVPSLPIVSH